MYALLLFALVLAGCSDQDAPTAPAPKTNTDSDDITSTPSLSPNPFDLFSDTFSDGMSAWTVDSGWKADTFAYPVPDETDGNRVAVVRSADCLGNCAMTTQPVDLSGASSATLSFHRWIDDTFAGSDTFTVEVGNDGVYDRLATFSDGDDVWHYKTYTLDEQHLSEKTTFRFTANIGGFDLSSLFGGDESAERVVAIDNVSVQGVQEQPDRPNLVVQNVSVSPTRVKSGGQIKIRYSVKNSGTARAGGGGSIRIYRHLSETDDPTTGGTQVGTSPLTTSLGVRSGLTRATNIKTPTFSSATTIYYYVCVDVADGEEQVDDNCGEAAVVKVRATVVAFVGSAYTDSLALVALFFATDGNNWYKRDGWLSDAPLSVWEGVSTDRNGRVDDLYLAHNNLNGEIPPELGQLDRLVRLEFGSNKLSGTIPPELGQLASLDRLILSRNELTGPIPPELDQLERLRVLWFDNNQLSGEIPPELGQLASLEEFGVQNNRLTGPIPPELGQLKRLVYLFVANNQLSGCIPAALLDVPNKYLPSLPECESTGGTAGTPPGGSAALDRLALVELYKATDGDNWIDNTNWLSDEPLAQWYGVDTENGRVWSLGLDANRLSWGTTGENRPTLQAETAIPSFQSLDRRDPLRNRQLDRIERLVAFRQPIDRRDSAGNRYARRIATARSLPQQVERAYTTPLRPTQQLKRTIP